MSCYVARSATSCHDSWSSRLELRGSRGVTLGEHADAELPVGLPLKRWADGSCDWRGRSATWPGASISGSRISMSISGRWEGCDRPQTMFTSSLASVIEVHASHRGARDVLLVEEILKKGLCRIEFPPSWIDKDQGG